LFAANSAFAQTVPPPPDGGFSLFTKDSPIFSDKQEDDTQKYETIEEAVDKKTRAFDFSQDKWNKARKATEEGTIEAPMPELPQTSVVVATETALNLPPSVELPAYGTSMSVTGRKIIGFNYTSKQYLSSQTNTSRAQSTSVFDIKQEMQVRMQGKVGPKVNVNVDYDDTKQDKQDISIVYQGDSSEVVQSASFGDIDLSLPSTEFISYNKQLFGIRMDLKYKGVKATFIGSRTKGTTKTKQFVGNTLFQGKDILDTSYTRRQYYDLTFASSTGRLPIVKGSEKVYVDNQNYITANNTNIYALTADDLNVQTSIYDGKFKLLTAGVDYTIDYNKGILTFTSARSATDVVAIDFTNANGTKLSTNSTPDPASAGGTGNVKLLKTKNDVYISTSAEMGYQREIKTYYNIGQTQIVRDDGKGNFTLQVQNLNRTEIGSSLNPKQVYSSTIDVDFEKGVFHLQNPFANTSDSSQKDPDIYATSPVSKYIIRVEYRARVKTFTLEANIVTQSEIVRVDGTKLTRNVDYYIDYDSGFITFYNENRIGSNSTVDITYDVSPYGGLGSSSLLGSRLSYDVNSHMSIGGTLMYETATKTRTAPNVTDLAKSLVVYEGDVQFKNIKLAPGLNSNWSFEGAQSHTNPNLNDFAIVDNMESIKQQTQASMEATDWQIASNPDDSVYGPADARAITWQSQDVKILDINPNSQAASGATQRVLTINYDLSVSSEVSIVYPFSTTGVDMSTKNMLQLVAYGDGTPGTPGPQINVHLGQINEDSDNSGGTTLYCKSGTVLTGVPKTEDLDCDGSLSSSEDIGWPYNAGQSVRYGANNGKIDTQDLNANGILDAQDYTGGDFGYDNASYFTDVTGGTIKNTFDFTGWHTLQANIDISSTDTYKWAAIGQVRISLKQVPGGKSKGTIQIAQLSAIGNTWEVVKASNSTGNVLQASGINNEDNPNYSPIFSAGGEATQVFNDLYGSASELMQENNTSTLTEQSLSLVYTSTGPARMATQRRFTNAINIAQHGQFKFLLNNPVTSEVSTTTFFYLRVGADTDYHEVRVPLNFTGWRLYTINQVDSDNDKVADTWENASNYTMYLSSAGSPDLSQVGIMTAGILTTHTDGTTHAGEVWFDEIHLGSPISYTGTAAKAQADFSLAGWAEFGGKYRYVDRNFETPVSASTKQDNEQTTSYLKITRLRYFPITADYSRQVVTTPNTLAVTNTNLVSLLAKGRVTTQTGKALGTLQLPNMPVLGLSYNLNKTSYDLLTREDDTRAYGSTLKYTAPKKTRLMPKTVDLSYTYTDSKTNYDSMVVLLSSGYYNAQEITHDASMKLAFTPWKDSQFSPQYLLKQVNEKRTDYSTGSPDTFQYPKSMQQTAGFTSNLRFASWLNPSVNYTVTTIETNNLTVSTATLGTDTTTYAVGQIKTVNRTANGTIGLTVNIKDLAPGSRLLQSMVVSNNYQLQDGDTWLNVEKDLNTKPALWLRNSLAPKSPFASRSSLTLRDTYTSSQRWRPLEGYGLSGRLVALRAMSLTNNYSKAIQRSETTGTYSKTVTTTLPDMLATFSQMEKMLYMESWASNMTSNIKYTLRKTETVGATLATEKSYGADTRFMIKNKLDTSLSFNMKTTETLDLTTDIISGSTMHRDASAQVSFDAGKARLTPRMDYTYDETLQGNGVATAQVTTIKPSLLVRADLNLPKGLRLPFMSKPLLFTNRVVWTTNASFAIKRSPVTETDNSSTFNLNSTADYELSKNLRLAINAMVERLWHKYLPQEEYISYQAGTTLTLQF